MAQTDYSVANQPGAAFRSDVNDVLSAIVSLNSGSSAPIVTFPYMFWIDTANNLLKMRNSANAAWATIGVPSATNLGLLALSGGTLTGALLASLGTVSLPGFAFAGDTDTGIWSAGANILGLVAAGVEYLRVTTTGISFLGTGAITLPVGTTGQRPGSPADGMFRYNSSTKALDAYMNSAWVSLLGVILGTAYAAKTTTYAILATDDVILYDTTSASFTSTLPTAVGIGGKVYTLILTNQTLANPLTIATTSSQTIGSGGGTTRKLSTQGETLKVMSDNANWVILDRRIVSDWTAYTPTFTGFGTVTAITCRWRRAGANLEIAGTYTSGTSTAVEARISLPSGLVSASSSLLGTLNAAGIQLRSAVGAANVSYWTLIEQSVAYITLGSTAGGAGSGGLAKQNGSAVVSNGETYSFTASIPITGWEG